MRYWFFYTLAFLFSLNTLVASPLQLRLLDEVQVESSSVTLGQIAAIQGGTAEQRLRVARIVVGEPPRLRNSAIIPSYRVVALLEQSGMANVKIEGAQTSVSTRSRSLDANEVKQRITHWLEGQLGEDTESEVTFLTLPTEWEIPAAEDTRIEAHASKNSLIGNVTVTLTASLGERVVTSLPVRLQITQFRQLVTTVRPVSKGEILSATDLTLERVALSKSSGMELANIDNAVGYLAKRNLPIGAIVSNSDIEAPLLVERGEPTRIIVLNGPVVMTALRDTLAGISPMAAINRVTLPSSVW